MLITAFLLLLGGHTNAQGNSPVVVVVADASAVTSLSLQQVQDIFLGYSQFFPDGSPVIAIDQPENSESYIEFYASALNMTPAQVRSHWARMTFTGRARPLRSVANDAALIELLQQDVRVIGYLARRAVNQHIKVVFEP